MFFYFFHLLSFPPSSFFFSLSLIFLSFFFLHLHFQRMMKFSAKFSKSTEELFERIKKINGFDKLVKDILAPLSKMKNPDEKNVDYARVLIDRECQRRRDIPPEEVGYLYRLTLWFHSLSTGYGSGRLEHSWIGLCIRNKSYDMLEILLLHPLIFVVDQGSDPDFLYLADFTNDEKVFVQVLTCGRGNEIGSSSYRRQRVNFGALFSYYESDPVSFCKRYREKHSLPPVVLVASVCAMAMKRLEKLEVKINNFLQSRRSKGGVALLLPQGTAIGPDQSLVSETKDLINTVLKAVENFKKMELFDLRTFDHDIFGEKDNLDELKKKWGQTIPKDLSLVDYLITLFESEAFITTVMIITETRNMKIAHDIGDNIAIESIRDQFMRFRTGMEKEMESLNRSIESHERNILNDLRTVATNFSVITTPDIIEKHFFSEEARIFVQKSIKSKEDRLDLAEFIDANINYLFQEEAEKYFLGPFTKFVDHNNAADEKGRLILSGEAVKCNVLLCVLLLKQNVEHDALNEEHFEIVVGRLSHLETCLARFSEITDNDPGVYEENIVSVVLYIMNLKFTIPYFKQRLEAEKSNKILNSSAVEIAKVLLSVFGETERIFNNNERLFKDVKYEKVGKNIAGAKAFFKEQQRVYEKKLQGNATAIAGQATTATGQAASTSPYGFVLGGESVQALKQGDSEPFHVKFSRSFSGQTPHLTIQVGRKKYQFNVTKKYIDEIFELLRKSKKMHKPIEDFSVSTDRVDFIVFAEKGGRYIGIKKA